MKAFSFQTEEEILQQMQSNPDLTFVVFSSFDKVSSMKDKVSNNCVLCSTSGEFTPSGYQDGAYTGFSYPKGEGQVVEIFYPPVRGLTLLRSAYEKVKNNPNAFLLLLCDGLSAMEEAITTSFYFTDPNFKIVGGSAGDNLKFTETMITIGKKRVFSVGIVFDCKTRTQILKENLYISTGKEMLITDSDTISRVARTFNNRPAATEYAHVLGVSESELPNYFMSNPLGRKMQGEVYIASPMKVNSDKSITFYSQIMPNTFVDILEIADHDEVIKKTASEVKVKPSFAFSVNCILRSLYFTQAKEWPLVNRQLLSICSNQAGFISYGEQYYKNHFNQTMVLLLVE